LAVQRTTLPDAKRSYRSYFISKLELESNST